ncbi:hypothetical protein IMSHALPRED_000302 [Imshaugia aleurites]|uniref:DUF7702 domain-containing protein n=1 Tax=Imshaugia aleurites TaxID=172621 RepID=A0A8H3ES06_9LECA|nr:hypothetical protein IMSHALPRED_000302 [Imshaugia aleurites]
MTVDYRDGVSILLLIFYLPALSIAILLTVRHGLKRSAGWRFMIIFALARILCACFSLATINQPNNVSLYIGYTVLIGVAISPLELVAFGLLSRITESINKSHQTFINQWHIQLAELLNTVGIILSIIGGVDSGTNYSKTGRYVPQTLTKVGLGLFIASFVAILAFTAILFMTISHAEPGERRILLAVAVSLPLLLVRLIYSAIYTFGDHMRFSALTGSVTILLCMALLEEIAIVVIYEGVGLTLRKVEKPQNAKGHPKSLPPGNDVEIGDHELTSM